MHVSPSTGKQFFKALMRRKPKGGEWSQPEPADWLHGHIPGRRRESAVLIRQVPTWRLERLGLNITGAFGSVKWEAKEQGSGVIVGAEWSHRAAEIQVGDHNDSRKRRRHHSQDW